MCFLWVSIGSHTAGVCVTGHSVAKSSSAFRVRIHIAGVGVTSRDVAIISSDYRHSAGVQFKVYRPIFIFCLRALSVIDCLNALLNFTIFGSRRTVPVLPCMIYTGNLHNIVEPLINLCVQSWTSRKG